MWRSWSRLKWIAFIVAGGFAACTSSQQQGAKQGAAASSLSLRVAIPQASAFNVTNIATVNSLQYLGRVSSSQAGCDASSAPRQGSIQSGEILTLPVQAGCAYVFYFAIGLPAGTGAPFLAYFESTSVLTVDAGNWDSQGPLQPNLRITAAGLQAGFTANALANAPAGGGATTPIASSPVTSNVPTYSASTASGLSPQPLGDNGVSASTGLGFQASTVPASSDSRIVEFHIRAGTGRGAWNDSSTGVNVRVGQVVRIINDDSITHRLHTNGAPCPHGQPIAPGSFGDCQISSPFASGPLYDHNTGGLFFISAGR